tara:strand:+ start:270 stop:503 length:234 start_codon:yes stop_codon:yes gene_type:complete
LQRLSTEESQFWLGHLKIAADSYRFSDAVVIIQFQLDEGIAEGGLVLPAHTSKQQVSFTGWAAGYQSPNRQEHHPDL